MVYACPSRMHGAQHQQEDTGVLIPGVNHEYYYEYYHGRCSFWQQHAPGINQTACMCCMCAQTGKNFCQHHASTQPLWHVLLVRTQHIVGAANGTCAMYRHTHALWKTSVQQDRGRRTMYVRWVHAHATCRQTVCVCWVHVHSMCRRTMYVCWVHVHSTCRRTMYVHWVHVHDTVGGPCACVMCMLMTRAGGPCARTGGHGSQAGTTPACLPPLHGSLLGQPMEASAAEAKGPLPSPRAMAWLPAPAA